MDPRPHALGGAHHLVHGSLERSQHIGQTERHVDWFIEALSSDESGNPTGFGGHRDLPESTTEVHLGPVLGLAKVLKAVHWVGHQVDIMLGG